MYNMSGSNNPFFGKKHTEEAREKMRIAFRRNRDAKPKIQLIPLTQRHSSVCLLCGKTYFCYKPPSLKKRKYCGRSCASKVTYLLKSDKMKRRCSEVSKGRTLSLETRKKLSESLLRLGPEWGRKISAAKLVSPKTKRGENHYGWKGGINPETARRALIYAAAGTHTKKQWKELKKKYNQTCLCCKKQEPFITLSADHIVPLSVGGSNDISNIQPLCRSCNSKKHTKTINYVANFQI